MTKVGDYHALFSAAQDVAECLDKSEKNLLTILTIKAVVANDLFTDDNFMCNKDCASVLQRELLESNTFVSDINNGRCDSVFPQVSQLKLPRNKLEDLYEQPIDSVSGCLL
ncbi:BnaC04g32880D [Brassica napus]|uniref:BnaC04g32880D protein n=1 Tax=Brassica napus TaxID=3708 RepID=A0A078HDC9_BRANA|nr:BnaC04g32880D [Brassica napus]